MKRLIKLLEEQLVDTYYLVQQDLARLDGLDKIASDYIVDYEDNLSPEDVKAIGTILNAYRIFKEKFDYTKTLISEVRKDCSDSIPL